MSGLLKNILIVLLILTIGAWIFTVARSCKKQDPTVVENVIDSDEDGSSDGNDEDLDELYADETDGEGDGELDGESTDEGDITESDDPESVDNLEETINLDEDLAEDSPGNSEETDESDNTEGTDRNNLPYQPHLVIAGSYLSEVNAKILLNKLKKAGYSESEIVVFDFSQYHTVCAGRFASSRNAHSTKRKIIDRGLAPEAYVHTKRPRKK